MDIKDLNIDYSKVKDTLTNLTSQLNTALDKAGTQLSESGFFDKLFSFLSDFFTKLANWINSLSNN